MSINEFIARRSIHNTFDGQSYKGELDKANNMLK